MSSENSVEAFLAREREELAGIIDDFGDQTTFLVVSPKHERGVEENVDEGNGEEINFGGQENGENGIDDQENGFDQAQIGFDGQQETGEENVVNGQENGGAGEEIFFEFQENGFPQEIDVGGEERNDFVSQQQKERLAKKDLHEEAEKQKLRDQAKRDLDEWYKKYNEKLRATMQRNRDLEAEMAIDRDSTGPGKKWERVARMCEFNPKSTRCTKDLSRFRGLLLELKNKK